MKPITNREKDILSKKLLLEVLALKMAHYIDADMNHASIGVLKPIVLNMDDKEFSWKLVDTGIHNNSFDNAEFLQTSKWELTYYNSEDEDEFIVVDTIPNILDRLSNTIRNENRYNCANNKYGFNIQNHILCLSKTQMLKLRVYHEEGEAIPRMKVKLDGFKATLTLTDYDRIIIIRDKVKVVEIRAYDVMTMIENMLETLAEED